jgi:hypothetical protein
MSAPTQYLMPVWMWESSGNLLQRVDYCPCPIRPAARRQQRIGCTPITGIDKEGREREAEQARHGIR